MSTRCECGGGFVCDYCRRNSTGASLRAGFALGTPNGPAPRPDLPPRTVAIEYLWAAESRVADLEAGIEKWCALWSDASLASLPLIQRVPLRHARDDLRALVGAETTRSEATP